MRCFPSLPSISKERKEGGKEGRKERRKEGERDGVERSGGGRRLSPWRARAPLAEVLDFSSGQTPGTSTRRISSLGTKDAAVSKPDTKSCFNGVQVQSLYQVSQSVDLGEFCSQYCPVLHFPSSKYLKIFSSLLKINMM